MEEMCGYGVPDESGISELSVSEESGHSPRVSCFSMSCERSLWKPLFWAFFSMMFVASSLGRERWCLHPKQKGEQAYFQCNWFGLPSSQFLSCDSTDCMSTVPFILSYEKGGSRNQPPNADILASSIALRNKLFLFILIGGQLTNLWVHSSWQETSETSRIAQAKNNKDISLHTVNRNAAPNTTSVS